MKWLLLHHGYIQECSADIAIITIPGWNHPYGIVIQVSLRPRFRLQLKLSTSKSNVQLQSRSFKFKVKLLTLKSNLQEVESLSSKSKFRVQFLQPDSVAHLSFQKLHCWFSRFLLGKCLKIDQVFTAGHYHFEIKLLPMATT